MEYCHIPIMTDIKKKQSPEEHWSVNGKHYRVIVQTNGQLVTVKVNYFQPCNPNCDPQLLYFHGIPPTRQTTQVSMLTMRSSLKQITMEYTNKAEPTAQRKRFHITPLSNLREKERLQGSEVCHSAYENEVRIRIHFGTFRHIYQPELPRNAK